jgi:hypothetical protein
MSLLRQGFGTSPRDPADEAEGTWYASHRCSIAVHSIGGEQRHYVGKRKRVRADTVRTLLARVYCGTQVKTTSVSHLIAFRIYLDKQKYICIVGWYERIRKSFLLCFEYLGILRTEFLT